MANYQSMTTDELIGVQKELAAAYEAYKGKKLKLDMSRGKPAPDQLDLANELLCCVSPEELAHAADGMDTRNYGGLDGIREMKELMSPMIGVAPSQIIVGGNSSLNMMYDTVSRAMTHGVCGSKPWAQCGKLKFLCPSPGYDRHFGVTEHFGFELAMVDMTLSGPDMDQVEKLIQDPAVKGIWCVPKYSNPQGITYSDETVRRFAALKPAAEDFRVFWDNAYAVHDLYEERKDVLLNVFEEAKKLGNEDLFYLFGSTSKISFAGGGVAVFGASERNIKDALKSMAVQTIGTDKINQLRHVKYYQSFDGVLEHMKKHAALIRPKFEMVLHTLDRELGSLAIASWTHPMGGYFVSLDTLDGCAKRVVSLCKEAGVVMTPAGATHPYGKDPRDRTIRIAPTYPSVAELQTAADLFCLCVKLASVEKLLSDKNA